MRWMGYWLDFQIFWVSSSSFSVQHMWQLPLQIGVFLVFPLNPFCLKYSKQVTVHNISIDALFPCVLHHFLLSALKIPFSSLLHFYIYLSPFERAICQKGERWWSYKTMMKQFPPDLEQLCLQKITFFPKTPLQGGLWAVSALRRLLWLLGSVTSGTLGNGQTPGNCSGLKQGTDVKLQPDVCVRQPVHGHSQEWVRVPCTWACVSVLRRVPGWEGATHSMFSKGVHMSV